MNEHESFVVNNISEADRFKSASIELWSKLFFFSIERGEKLPQVKLKIELKFGISSIFHETNSRHSS